MGVTANLFNRIQEHKNGFNKNSFTYRYNLHYLIYYEFCSTIVEAIAREKEIKNLLREKKIALIESVNPGWTFLNKEICGHWPPKFDGR